MSSYSMKYIWGIIQITTVWRMRNIQMAILIVGALKAIKDKIRIPEIF